MCVHMKWATGQTETFSAFSDSFRNKRRRSLSLLLSLLLLLTFWFVFLYAAAAAGCCCNAAILDFHIIIGREFLGYFFLLRENQATPSSTETTTDSSSSSSLTVLCCCFCCWCHFCVIYTFLSSRRFALWKINLRRYSWNELKMYLFFEKEFLCFEKFFLFPENISFFSFLGKNFLSFQKFFDFLSFQTRFLDFRKSKLHLSGYFHWSCKFRFCGRLWFPHFWLERKNPIKQRRVSTAILKTFSICSTLHF